jgi:hypothetical protein
VNRGQVPDKELKLPLRFRVTEAQKDLLRKFWIRKGGLGPPTGKPNHVYRFPPRASVRHADGPTAHKRINVERAESVEFVKAVW